MCFLGSVYIGVWPSYVHLHGWDFKPYTCDLNEILYVLKCSLVHSTAEHIQNKMHLCLFLGVGAGV